MTKVLVTGAGGYIGRHIISKLLDKGADVSAVDIAFSEIDSRIKTVIEADIFDGDPQIFKRLGNPNVCLHMAWKDGFVHHSDEHMLNLSKHYEFINNMLKGGLSHIAVMGSMHEVGYHEGAIDENTPCNPISMYGISKDSLRRALIRKLDGTDVVWQWIRAFYIYGDDEKNNSIFTKLVQAEKEGKLEFPFTTGKNKYDFISVTELADQISACVLQDKITGIINCCSGRPVSLAEQVEKFIAQKGLKIRLKYGAFPDRTYDSPVVFGDSLKITKIMRG